MIARLHITTLSGFLIYAYVDIPKSLYEEFSLELIKSNTLPDSIREGIIPNHLDCMLFRDNTNNHINYEKLGKGKFPGPTPKTSFFFRFHYWWNDLMRALDLVGTLKALLP